MFSRKFVVFLNIILTFVAVVPGAESSTQAKLQGQETEICRGLAEETTGSPDGSPETISFTKNEKQFLCGDQDNKPWSKIPNNQRAFFLRNILQSKGYHNPTIRTLNNQVIFKSGPISRLKSTKFEKDAKPSSMDFSHFQGRVLTPSLLDEIKSYSDELLVFDGYPCAVVVLEADINKDSLKVSADELVKPEIAAVRLKSKGPFTNEVYRRYDAFKLGQRFDFIKLALTERRIVSAGIAGNSFFTYNCQLGDFVLDHHNTEKLPRTIGFGFGVNSEGVFLVKGHYKHSALDKNGSQVLTSLQLSFTKQLWRTELFYFLKPEARDYWKPELEVLREDDTKVESVLSSLYLPYGGSYDAQNFSYKIHLGPAYEVSKTISGLGAGYTRALSVKASLDIMSHSYEYFLAAPQQGYSFNLGIVNSDKARLASYSATNISTFAQALVRSGTAKTPDLVLGMRLGASSTAAKDKEMEALPASMYQYLGGANNLRGFSFKELPVGDEAALTSFYSGLELRYVPRSFSSLHPFLFIDYGRLGGANFALHEQSYWSPGVGVRLDFGFGPIRLFMAHGFLAGHSREQTDSHSHLQFYGSFGEEF